MRRRARRPAHREADNKAQPGRPSGVLVSERISSVETIDVRFPTSRHRDGSDAMNPFPDYSAAYVVVRTSAGAEGHGLVFTVGRGTDLQVAAVQALAPMVVGQRVDELVADPGALARRLVGDSQIRWLGPEKGSCTWPPVVW
ncbi:hypothetical protein GCM10029963_12700 [Micromonospora andamanensis]